MTAESVLNAPADAVASDVYAADVEAAIEPDTLAKAVAPAVDSDATAVDVEAAIDDER